MHRHELMSHETHRSLERDGWRWAFLIKLPIGIGALLVVQINFTTPGKRRAQCIDHAGASGLIVCLDLCVVSRLRQKRSPTTAAGVTARYEIGGGSIGAGCTSPGGVASSEKSS
ncbi:hypothetical protein CJD44_01375 [Streptomyces sp. alain-838]|nr:hypothetical protein CJD44_01375 [Streptomyces sp. alain-838]